MKKFIFAILFLFFISLLTVLSSAQTKKINSRKTNPQPAATATPKQDETSEEFSVPKEQIKKNARPSDETKNNSQLNKTENPPIYFYEFSQPDFLVSKVFIEHNENGKGKITFQEKNIDEMVSDPIQLSTATLEKLQTLWNTLNFLDSTEVYQSAERDYGHLGNMKFTKKKDGRERTVGFNWTENLDARALADEYRRISNQFVWIFEVGVARENQPLETPQKMDALDSLIRRNEIADPEQMIPFLKELSNDEHIPLIARNHAARLVQQIEKQTAKKDKR